MEVAGPSEESQLQSGEESASQSDAETDYNFCFEADTPELKNNNDYRELMKTMMKLIYLRSDTIQRTEHLYKLVIMLKKDPEAFIANLLEGKIELPSDSIPIPEVPEIDFSKYDIPTNNCDSGDVSILEFMSQYLNKSNECSQEENQKEKNQLVVRGRQFDDSKPQTFNQLWTAEEQVRLEELLVKYPPEKKESRRWVKIAAALGNRTPKQVCSRVQKYFVKLRKMGFSVPGRKPRTSFIKNKGRPIKKNFIDKSTTFFPKLDNIEPTILPSTTSGDKIDESSSVEAGHSGVSTKITDDKTSIDESDSGDEIGNVDWLTNSKRLEILLRIKADKEKNRHVRHFNISCSNCGESPIVNTRWTCYLCSLVDFCSDCMIDLINNRLQFDNHPISHPLDPVDTYDCVRDPDYFPDKFSSANYLDPNFIVH